MPKKKSTKATVAHTSVSSVSISPYQEIWVGDVRNAASLLPPSSVQAIVTSPPYWGLRSYGAEKEIGAESTLPEYLDEMSGVFASLRHALRNDGTMWLVLGDTYTSGNRTYRHSDKKHLHRAMVKRPKTPDGLKPKDLIGLAWRVAFRLQEDGWYLRSETIWNKLNPLPESVKDRPHLAHEHVFLFSKCQKYSFDWGALRAFDSTRFRPSRSVWSTSVNTGIKGHAAPFPIELIKPCVAASTAPGDVILDPFAGSGSVGIACEALGRRFLGIELIQENVDLALERSRQRVNGSL